MGGFFVLRWFLLGSLKANLSGKKAFGSKRNGLLFLDCLWGIGIVI